MESLDAVELVMALEELAGAEGMGLDPQAPLGDLHWRMQQQERHREPPRRSADQIWNDLAHLLKEQGIPAVQITPQTRLVDLIV